MKIRSKQIDRVIAASIRVNGLSVVSSSSSTVVTTAITTALSTASDGSAVPLVVSSSNGVGVITTGSNNRVEVYNGTSKDKILATNGEEVYGRLTESSSIYTLSYFTLSNSGTETSYTFDNSTTLDFEFGYRFELHQLPTDAIIGQRTRNISDDASGGGGSLFGESLAITATNTIASLTKTPLTQSIINLSINGQIQRPGIDFTVSGKSITWIPASSLFDLNTTDTAYVIYSTLE
jgi:hypothetical protein